MSSNFSDLFKAVFKFSRQNYIFSHFHIALFFFSGSLTAVDYEHCVPLMITN